MTRITLFLLGLLPSKVFALNIETLGRGAPGIDAMWIKIKQVFPHTNVPQNATMWGVPYITMRIASFLVRMVGGVAVGVIIYAGFRLVLSRGNDEGFNKAKEILIYTTFGLILVILTDAIINFAMVLILDAAV